MEKLEILLSDLGNLLGWLTEPTPLWLTFVLAGILVVAGRSRD